MNLNTIETAEALENISFVTDPTIVCNYAATMLRTIPALQAEIEALKAEIKILDSVNLNLEETLKRLIGRVNK